MMLKQCLKKFFQQFVDLLDLISCIKLHIQCNLVIAAASGVQLFAGIADAVDQICLHKAVDIFVFVCDLQCSVLNITQNALQAFQDLITLCFSQNTLLLPAFSHVPCFLRYPVCKISDQTIMDALKL